MNVFCSTESNIPAPATSTSTSRVHKLSCGPSSGAVPRVWDIPCQDWARHKSSRVALPLKLGSRGKRLSKPSFPCQGPGDQSCGVTNPGLLLVARALWPTGFQPHGGLGEGTCSLLELCRQEGDIYMNWCSRRGRKNTKIGRCLCHLVVTIYWWGWIMGCWPSSQDCP